jgi:hypothetical protein
MKPLLAATVLATAAAALAPSAASARTFSYGVASAEVTPTSALLWARPLKAGKVQLEVAEDKRFARHHFTKNLTTSKANDLTAQARIKGLTPGKRYWYFFHQGRQRSQIGTFATAPKPTSAKGIRFAVSGDAMGNRVNGANYWNKDGSKDMGTYTSMAKEKNDFNVNLGDTIYSDPTPELGVPFAFTLDRKRQFYRENLTYPSLLRLRESGPVYNQFDDHEFIDDFTRQSQACDVGAVFNPQYACDIPGLWSSGLKAFREYMPVTYSAADGSYRTFRWGKNVEIFILDERSFRSLRASETKDDPSQPEPTTHVCQNPAGTGEDDPAPQVPQRIRGLFAFVYPPAANPARPECLAALNDPKRTMLVEELECDMEGRRQRAADHGRRPQPVRRVGRLPGRAQEAAHVHQEQRQECGLRDDGFPLELGQRSAHLDLPGGRRRAGQRRDGVRRGRRGGPPLGPRDRRLHRLAGQLQAVRQRVLLQAAAGRSRHAVLEPGHVRLRAADREGEDAHGRDEGRQRQADRRHAGRQGLRAVRAEG